MKCHIKRNAEDVYSRFYNFLLVSITNITHCYRTWSLGKICVFYVYFSFVDSDIISVSTLAFLNVWKIINKVIVVCCCEADKRFLKFSKSSSGTRMIVFETHLKII